MSVADATAYLDVDSRTNNTSEVSLKTIWSVQIGSFAKRANAHKAAARARRVADNVLGQSPARLTLVTRGNLPLWRVRFNNLDEDRPVCLRRAVCQKGAAVFCRTGTAEAGRLSPAVS